MARYFFVVFFLGIISFGTAQNRYENEPDQPFLPVLPDSMSYQEYEMATRSLSWQRLMIASFVPGYIHFYARHKTAAYAIAAIRGAGIILSTTGLIRQWRESKQLNLKLLGDSETNLYLFISGLILNAAGYAFDIAHGDYLISRERTRIEFKFRQIRQNGCAAIFPNAKFSMLSMVVRF